MVGRYVTVFLSVMSQVLSDDDKRRMYDATGHSEYSATGAPGRPALTNTHTRTHGARDDVFVFVYHQILCCSLGGGSPFTEMKAEEIFRQFFGGDFNFGSFYDQEYATNTHQVGRHPSSLLVPYLLLFF